MSLNDDLIMELLDGEVPEQFLQRVEAEIASDPAAAKKLQHFRNIQQAMHAGDEPNFDEMKDRVQLRLQRSISASAHSSGQNEDEDIPGHTIQFPQGRARDRTRTQAGGIRISTPIAAVAGLVFVAAIVLNFIPGFGPTRGSGAVASDQAATFGLSVDNSGEVSDIDPNMRALFSASSTLSGDTGTPTQGDQQNAEHEGINLQINVQDVEQLLRLLEGTRNLGGNLNDITIQLPTERQFEILGESQLRKALPQGAE